MRVTIHYDNKENLYNSIITWLNVSITYLTAEKMSLEATNKIQAKDSLVEELKLAKHIKQKLNDNKEQNIDLLKTQLSLITDLGLQRKESGYGTTTFMDEALQIVFKVEQYYPKQQNQQGLKS